MLGIESAGHMSEAGRCGTMFFWTRIWKKSQLSSLKLKLDMDRDPTEAKFLGPDLDAQLRSQIIEEQK